MTEKSFASKVLLFGEYSIILNSMGLSVPFPLFEGHLAFPHQRTNSQARESNSELRSFFHYLQELEGSDQLHEGFDLASFEFDIQQGLYFESTIPQGFGVGSSAAVCAAIYDRYTSKERKINGNLDEKNIIELKQIFSNLESHFHGKSSGLDTLICYLGKPVLCENKKNLGPVNLDPFTSSGGAVFLLNTGRPRRTEPLVNLFLEKCSQKNFSRLCEIEFKKYNNDCIKSFLERDLYGLFENLKLLSHFQFEHLTPMIPNLYRKVWNKGLNSGDFYLKLCGAGGGGFLLGFTKDFEKLRELLKGEQIRVIQNI